MTRVHRAVTTPSRQHLDTEQLWHGEDRGVIAAWERGRQKSSEDPELAARAKAGELIILPWKGGVEKALKSGQKYGTHRYLAMWQGLRGDDLDVDLSNEAQLQCTVTGVMVIYTSDVAKYAGKDA